MMTHSIYIKRMKLNKWRNIRLNDPLRNNRFQFFFLKKIKVFYCITEWKNWVICIFHLLPNCQLSLPVTLQCKTNLIKLLPSLCPIRPSPQLLNKHSQVFCFKVLISSHKYKKPRQMCILNKTPANISCDKLNTTATFHMSYKAINNIH